MRSDTSIEIRVSARDAQALGAIASEVAAVDSAGAAFLDVSSLNCPGGQRNRPPGAFSQSIKT
jgi:hypothetical protein